MIILKVDLSNGSCSQRNRKNSSALFEMKLNNAESLFRSYF